MKKKNYELGDLTCGGCINSVKKALLEISDLTEANIHLNPPTAELTMKKSVTLEALRAQLKKVGQFTISELVTQ